MVKVGIRELRGRFGLYLGKVQKGEAVVITKREEPIATILPVEKGYKKIAPLVSQGLVRWNTGKPKGAKVLITAPGKSLSHIVLEQRR